jgi:hypothetical protein
MGSLYRPKLKSGAEGRILWCKYYVNGRPVRESTKCDREQDARRFLKLREGAVANGAPVSPRADRVLSDELAADLLEFYRTTGRWKNLDDVEDRLTHLGRFFTGSGPRRSRPTCSRGTWRSARVSRRGWAARRRAVRSTSSSR